MKIEAGCKAVIVNSAVGNDGIIVTVLGVAAPPGSYDYDPEDGEIWRVDKELVDSWGGYGCYTPEFYLRRIDDDSRQITSWEALADIYKPPLKKVVGAKA